MIVRSLICAVVCCAWAASAHAQFRDLAGLSPEARTYTDEANADTALTNNVHGVLLLDEQEVRLRPDGSSSIRVHRIIRVVTPYARSRHRMVFFQYNALVDRVRMDFAGTQTPDGKWHNAGPGALRDTLVQGVGPFRFYHNLRQYVFLVPDPVPGSVVEYQYVIDRQRQLLPGQFEARFTFASDDASLHVKRVLVVPDSVSIHLFAGGNTPAPRVTTANGERRYEWTADRVRALTVEYSAPIQDAASTVLASTLDSWHTLASEMRAALDKASAPTPEIRSLVNTTVGKKTGEAAMRAIYNLVATTVTGILVFEFQTSGVEPEPAADIWANKAGDSKDHACLLAACLRAGGFPVTFVLSNLVVPPDTSAPAITQFNHVSVITETPAKKRVWLDSQTETAPFGVIPGQMQGRPVLVLNADRARIEIAPLSRPSENTETVTFDLTISEKGAMTGTMKTVSTGVMEMQARGMLKKAGPTGRRDFFSKRRTFIASNAELTGFVVTPPGDLSLPFSVKIDLSNPKWGTVEADTIFGELPSGYTSIPIPGLPQWVYEGSRKADLDVSVLSPTFTIAKHYTLRLPEGYRIGVTRQEPVRTSVGEFTRTWSLSGNVAYLVETLTLVKPRIPPEEYQTLRELWFSAAAAEADPIRLVKRAS